MKRDTVDALGGAMHGPQQPLTRRMFLERVFLGGTFAAGITAAAFVPFGGYAAAGPVEDASQSPHRIVAMAWTVDGYQLFILDDSGHILSRTPLEGRGHGIAVAPTGRGFAVFSRRPGEYAHIFQLDALDTPRLLGTLAPNDGYMFNGHGVFSADGQTLYTSENNAETEHGAIGVYMLEIALEEAGQEGPKCVDYFSSHGIGPHEVVLHPNGQDLIVANGGRLTHPDFPREVLNRGELDSSIAVVDGRSGALIQSYAPPEPKGQVSLRHVAILGTKLWWGAQLEPGADLTIPVAGYIDLESDKVVPWVNPMMEDLRGYIGSVATQPALSEATDHAAGRVILTSPRGNMAVALDAETLDVSEVWKRHDVCAIGSAGAGQPPILADGTGDIGPASQPISWHKTKWDNHLAVIKPVRG